MPIPAPYQTFAEICIEQNVGYQQWQKTAETDKILNLLYDQIVGRSSTGTQIVRGQALIAYLAVKRLITLPIYDDAPADARLETNELSYASLLITRGEAQFGLCGRLHRVLTSVLNEMTANGSPATQRDIVSQWITNVVDGLYAGIALLPPIVAPLTLYQIDGFDVEVNTGATINVPALTAITLATSGIGQTDQNWQLTEVDIATETDDTLILAVPTTGVYRNRYSNAAEDVYSVEFDLLVAV